MVMIIVACLLVVSSVAICYASYEQTAASVFKELNSAISRSGGMGKHYYEEDRDGDYHFRGKGKHSNDYEESPLELGISERHDASFPIAVYALDSDGSLVALSSIGNVAISDNLLNTVADAIKKTPDGTGTLDSLGLAYAKRTTGNYTLVAFADFSAINSWRSLILVLVAVDVVVLLAFFGISILLANWALSPVRKAWLQQKRFISDASHELKTPLAVMAANVSILKRNWGDTVASQSQWVESTETEIAEMQQLVNDMLLIASTDEGANKEGFSPLNLSRLIEGQLLQLESLGFEKGVNIASDIQDGIQIEGQKNQLERLVRTLLENAFKYTPKDGQIRVSLNLAANQKPVFSVFNTGTTIPKEDIPHIFDRFYRVDSARERSTGGHGLGLSIARDIAEANGATLQVESEEASGTGFIVAWH